MACGSLWVCLTERRANCSGHSQSPYSGARIPLYGDCECVSLKVVPTAQVTHSRHTAQSYVGAAETLVQPFLTSAWDGQPSAKRPGRFNPGKRVFWQTGLHSRSGIETRTVWVSSAVTVLSMGDTTELWWNVWGCTRRDFRLPPGCR